MPVTVRSFAKINLGLRIGALRPDRFHELRTIYQTIGLHDRITVDIRRGSTTGPAVEIRCTDVRVPKDSSNTCWRIAELTMAALKRRGKVVIDIQKMLPIQGGLGGASGNAVSVMLALELVTGQSLSPVQRLAIAAQVGSDLPLFVLGGTTLGVSHGEEVYPLPELPSVHCLVALPNVGVSTPKAFADWDAILAKQTAQAKQSPQPRVADLTQAPQPATLGEFCGHYVSWWFGAFSLNASRTSGVPIRRVGDRAETLLLELDRTGIEKDAKIVNDFEQVVFPQHPELMEVKRALLRAGARYASLSGSGSALFGLFATGDSARAAAEKLRRKGVETRVTRTLTRQQYWKRLVVDSSRSQ